VGALAAFDTAFSASATLFQASGSCALQTGLQADSLMVFQTVATLKTCQNATFTVSATLQFPAGAVVGALQTWSIQNVVFRGPRFTLVSPGPGQAVPRLIAKLLSTSAPRA
jgi:hypothetical protein